MFKNLAWIPLVNKLVLFNYFLNNIEKKKKRGIVKSAPPVILVESTNMCNLDCIVCHRFLQNRKYGQMELEKFKIILKQIPTLSVGLQGFGEPLITKDLIDMIEYCDSKGILSNFTTNGTLFDDEIINRLSKSKLLTTIAISFDYIHLEGIQKKQNLNIYIKNIKKLKEAFATKRPETNIFFAVTLTKHDLGQLDDMIDLARECGISKIVIHNVTIFDSRLKGSMYESPEREDIEKYCSKARNKGKSMGIEVDYSYFAKWFNEELEKRICLAPWCHTFITWDGYVHPCCHHLDEPFGNIFKEKWPEIWNGKKYILFRKAFVEGKLDNICRKCKSKEWR